MLRSVGEKSLELRFEKEARSYPFESAQAAVAFPVYCLMFPRGAGIYFGMRAYTRSRASWSSPIFKIGSLVRYVLPKLPYNYFRRCRCIT